MNDTDKTGSSEQHCGHEQGEKQEDVTMADEENETAKETASDHAKAEGETSEEKTRRFPAVDFDEEAPAGHAFYMQMTGAPRSFMRAVRKDLDLLTKHLPDGIFVKAFEDRMDLLSLLIVGPKGTPFSDVPFVFDVHLPTTYPTEPPRVHYWAFSQEQLNPNLYQNGKVCVSLLGTWNGKGSEQWTEESNLLQVFLSIQGLILVPEPYFNEAGYEARKNAAIAVERSRRYNEMALVNSLDYFYRIVRNPPKRFEKIITEHCMAVLPALIERVSAWESGSAMPDFPLWPISEGCRLSLRKIIVILKRLLEGSPLDEDTPQADDSTHTAASF